MNGMIIISCPLDNLDVYYEQTLQNVPVGTSDAEDVSEVCHDRDDCAQGPAKVKLGVQNDMYVPRPDELVGQSWWDPLSTRSIGNGGTPTRCSHNTCHHSGSNSSSSSISNCCSSPF